MSNGGLGGRFVRINQGVKHYLTMDEVKAVMARRDKVVEQFQKLITEKGEKEVLY